MHLFSGDPTPFLQDVLDLESTETEKDKMLINEFKCNIINFNNSNENIVPQQLVLHGNKINSVGRINLLGVIITNDLRWREKVNKKLF